MRRIDDVLPDVLDGERIDRVVSMLADIPRSQASQLVDDGAVSLDDTVTTKRSSRVEAGQTISFEYPDATAPSVVVAQSGIAFEVAYEDEHLAVVHKPAGLVVHPGAGNDSGTLVHGLLEAYPEIEGLGDADRPGIVHRLDRDTSGLLVVARTPDAFDRLKAMMAAHTVTRRYRALAWGHMAEPQGLIDAPIARSPRDPTRMSVVVGGKAARTRYEVVARYEHPVPVTEVVCRLETGRTHQIRVHLQALGHPVVGDSRYGGQRESFPLPRQFLHAEHLAFEHPITRAQVSVDADLPDELAAVVASLT